MILLSSSSFFLPRYLSQKLVSGDFSTAQFNYALKNNYVEALTLEEAKAERGSANWLTLNKSLAKTKQGTALKLGKWYQSSLNDAQDTRVYEQLNIQAIIWLEQAIRLGSHEAIVELAQLYYEQDKISNAVEIINLFPELQDNKRPASTLAEAALVLRIELAIYQGDANRIKLLVEPAKGNAYANKSIARLFRDIDKYNIIKNKRNNSHAKPMIENTIQGIQGSSCISSLQLFATNIKHLRHLEQLSQSFKSQELGQFVCLPPPRYLSKKHLDCNSSSSLAIQCDELKWQRVVDEVKSKHVGLMLEKGGANVHLGILYFDAEDDTNVFSHEVSHLLGFVDEYPLVNTHAICQAVQTKRFSYNIAVLNQYYHGDRKIIRERLLKEVPWSNSIKADTPILEAVSAKPKEAKLWRLGTPINYDGEVGIYLSETCQNSNTDEDKKVSFSSFKPLNYHTALRSLTSDFPKEYIDFIVDDSVSYQMPSYHYNIALALFQRGEVSTAKLWLEKASRWETEPLRKLTVLRGGF